MKNIFGIAYATIGAMANHLITLLAVSPEVHARANKFQNEMNTNALCYVGVSNERNKLRRIRYRG